MKKTIKTIEMTILVGITVILFNGCKGKDGEPGAQGPQGNANVIASTGTTINSSWVELTFPYEWDVTFNVPEITSDVVTSGSVQVFWSPDGTGNSWQALPFSYTNIQYNYEYGLGQITIFVTNTDGSEPGNPGGQVFKFVVMPSRAMMAHPHLNVKNYNEVKQVFNLK